MQSAAGNSQSRHEHPLEPETTKAAPHTMQRAHPAGLRSPAPGRRNPSALPKASCVRRLRHLAAKCQYHALLSCSAS
jgi:hypothetical protein